MDEEWSFWRIMAAGLLLAAAIGLFFYDFNDCVEYQRSRGKSAGCAALLCLDE